VPAEDLLRFLRRLQVKLKAGLAVDRAMAALVTETRNKRLRRACKGIQTQVATKPSLAAAMAEQRGVFDASVLRLVDDGEQRGQLRSGLAAATEQVQRTGELRRDLRKAVAKPLAALLTVLLAVFVAAVALSFMVKEFLPSVGGGHHGGLTTADLIAIRAADVLRTSWPFLGACGALALAAAHLLPRIHRTRALLESVGRRLPLVGEAYRRTSLASFAWTIGILARAGVRFDEAMPIAAVTANDKQMGDIIASTVRAIEAGKPYLDAMAEVGLLRRRDVATVSAAERRGELAAALLTVAADFQREAAERVSRLRTVVHTFVVLALALAIVSVGLTLYVPVFVLR
jgi:type II secretory pathway component PulF